MNFMSPSANGLYAVALVSSVLQISCSSPQLVESFKPLEPQEKTLSKTGDLNVYTYNRSGSPPTWNSRNGTIRVLKPYEYPRPGYYDEPPRDSHRRKVYTNISIKRPDNNRTVTYTPLGNNGAVGHPHYGHSVKRPVLFIGDSHSTTVFGSTLTTLIEQQIPGAQVTAIASCGSSPDWWLDGNKQTRCGFWQHNADGSEENGLRGMTPQLDELIQSLQPQTIIVALGANLVPQNKAERILHTTNLMRKVTDANRQCFWIGPPDARKFTRQQIDDVYVLLGNISRDYDCHLIDSRSYTNYPKSGGDGLHYSGKEGESIAKNWAIQIFQNYIQNEIL